MIGKKCIMFVTDKYNKRILLLKEKYTNERIQEWASWDDWRPVDLTNLLKQYTKEDVIDMNIDTDIKMEWINHIENASLDLEVVKRWVRSGLIFPESILNQLGKWGVPKGEKELNENHKQCALRELKEEINIDMDMIRTINYIGEMQNRYVYHVQLKNDITNLNLIKGPEIIYYNWCNIDFIQSIDWKPYMNSSVRFIKYFN